MQTECTAAQLEFEGLGTRRVVAAFTAGRTSSEGGLLLLREVSERRDLLPRFAQCFGDLRDPRRVEHTVEELVSQRVLALACGYEDLNDHDTLRDDPLLALAAGKPDPTGASRPRVRDQGHALAARSTLNRLERTPAEATSEERYHKIVYDAEAIERFLVEVFLETHEIPPARIILDLDATDDPLHGEQEGRFFHGYYGHYCYLPLYIFCGDHLLCAKLRPSNIDASAGALEEVQRIVAQIRARWTEVEIWLRADSGFAREETMCWCEQNHVHYVFGLARNERLRGLLASDLEAVAQEQAQRGGVVRRYRELRYRTLKTWSRERRVIGKAEQLPGKSNPRFVVTSLAPEFFDSQRVYEKIYCARGDMENRIKEQQLGMFADRTSTQTMRANQLRLGFSSVAYVLVNELRRLGLQGTVLERAQVGTIRTRLLKIAAVIRISVRRVYVALSSVYPLQRLFARVLANLQRARASPASA